jgi:hypothetical protein
MDGLWHALLALHEDEDRRLDPIPHHLAKGKQLAVLTAHKDQFLLDDI